MASFPAPPPMASPFEAMARDMAPPSPRAADSDDGEPLEAKTQGPVHSSVRLGSLLPYVKPKVRDKVLQAASNKEGHLTAQDLVHVFHSEDDATNKARKLFWLSLGLVVLLAVTLIANAALTYAVIVLSKDTEIDNEVLVVKGSSAAPVQVASRDLYIDSDTGVMRTRGSGEATIRTAVAFDTRYSADPLLWVTSENATDVHSLTITTIDGRLVHHQIVGLEVEPGQKAVLYSSSGTTITVTNEGGVTFDPPMKTDQNLTTLGDLGDEEEGGGRRRLLSRADVQVSLNAGGAAAMKSDAPTVDPGRWTNSRSAREQSAKITAMLDRNDEDGVRRLFARWSVQFGRNYEGPEFQQRLQNFKNSLRTIAKVNSDPSTTWTAGPNQYAALSPQEFAQTFLGASVPPGTMDATGSNTITRGLSSEAPLKSSVDWEQKGYVTPIRSQGACGSCWAFAAAAAVESQILIKFKKKIDRAQLDLSEQQLVDCVSRSKGCSGGWPTDALDYVRSVGLAYESEYPYTGKTGTCSFANDTAEIMRIEDSQSSNIRVESGSRDALLRAIMSSPVIVTMWIDESFQYYMGGVYNGINANDGKMCINNSVNHALLAVGYNLDEGWVKLKNSWGTNWGEAGFARMQLSTDSAGTCGLYHYAFRTSPKIKRKKLSPPS